MLGITQMAALKSLSDSFDIRIILVFTDAASLVEIEIYFVLPRLAIFD